MAAPLQGNFNTPSSERELDLRARALGFAVEWARSSGPEHSTRVPPVEFVEAADRFYKFLKGDKTNGS